MSIALLDDRSILSVTGEDAEHFLQNILTVDLEGLAPGVAMPGALLSPQGKILFDFLISRRGDGFDLEVRADIADDFARRLMMYRLRAKVAIAKHDQGLVEVAWGRDSSAFEAASDDAGTTVTRLRDARFSHELVYRIYAAVPPPLTQPGQATGLARPSDPLKGEGDGGVSEFPSPLRGGGDSNTATAAAWHAFRIASGVPESGGDYALGDAFPHDVLLDQNGGVGFRKGCYIGQEVVSRMQHRGTARRRFLIARGDGDLPPAGTKISAGGRAIGTLGSVAGTEGLALVRIDKVKAAMDDNVPILAGAAPIALSIPPWARFVFPDAAPSGDEA